MVETLYWVGCMATYRLPEVAKAIQIRSRILQE